MGTFYTDTAIVIPALNPNDQMVTLVRELREAGFQQIILVDDGSETENRKYFRICKDTYGCHVIRHVVNFGKGMALKSAFNHILDNCPDITGTVTVDCDGQHTPADIITCAKLTAEYPDHLILGCRRFDEKGIPLRSRFGNKFTKHVIRLLCGINISDTQTGLRGMSRRLIRDFFANTKGERFEYEMNMLLCAREHQIPIREFPIHTIYLEHNKSSHFNPFVDSIRIYKVFFKFMLSSISSFMIDIVLYYLLGLLLRPVVSDRIQISLLGINMSLLILLRSALSRLGSSLYNFTLNKRQVFRNDSKDVTILLKYYILCICQLILSSFLVDKALSFIASSTIRKCIIDTILFTVSFQIQREWVFRPSKKKGTVKK